jgi:hypothetical protein
VRACGDPLPLPGGRRRGRAPGLRRPRAQRRAGFLRGSARCRAQHD